jgi:putative component of membrane protein insertase Oxa1/YidC/SpoIIIJ protein YidD
MNECRDIRGCDKPAVGVLVGRGTYSGGRLIGRVQRCQPHLNEAADKMRKIGFTVGQVDLETAEKLRKEEESA